MRAIIITLATFLLAGCTSETETTQNENPAPAPVQQVEKPPEKVAPQPNEPIAPAKPKNPLEAKLTAENYLRIKEGMPRDEVLLILGQPTESNFEDSDKRLRESGASREYIVGLVTVREQWILKRANGLRERNIDVDFKWEPEKPGSLLGGWKVVRKSHFGLQ